MWGRVIEKVGGWGDGGKSPCAFERVPDLVHVEVELNGGGAVFVVFGLADAGSS